MNTTKSLSANQQQELLQTLQTRFTDNMQRHENVEWSRIQKKLEANPQLLWSLSEMERTGGEPDVVVLDSQSTTVVFCDCSSESPAGRRNFCYDREALESRKAHKPKNSAMDVAKEMGIEILTEEQYKQLQKLGEFDLKTSSWLQTPSEIRKLGGALFADRRYDHVFVYHNGAESYYAARGFRGMLNI